MLQIVGALILLIAGFAILRLLFRALISTASALAGLILLCLFDPGMHFRRVIRNAEGQRRWRCRNSEPDAGKVLNTRLASDGLL
ncbi:DUF905 family protein, partial [Escherichia coli]|uniref:DUF905 family protein n=1 Tax=Escherichia coli TaxID=562 RepID=UPI00383BBCD8